MRGVEQVQTARDQRDTLQGVVDGYRKMIAGGDVLPRQNNIAKRFRIGHNVARLHIVPGKIADHGGCGGHINPHGVLLTVTDSFLAFLVTQMPAGTRVEHALRPMRRCRAAGHEEERGWRRN